FRVPFDKFPGVFSIIDRYEKRAVEYWIDLYDHAPDWLGDFKDATGYRKVGRLYFEDEETDVLLSGEMDVLLDLPDGTLAIGDYKTSKRTSTQDALFSQYEVQLNAYALLS